LITYKQEKTTLNYAYSKNYNFIFRLVFIMVIIPTNFNIYN